MRFPNPCGYYRVFGARDGSGFPTAIQRDSVAELGIFPQPARKRRSMEGLPTIRPEPRFTCSTSPYVWSGRYIRCYLSFDSCGSPSRLLRAFSGFQSNSRFLRLPRSPNLGIGRSLTCRLPKTQARRFPAFHPRSHIPNLRRASRRRLPRPLHPASRLLPQRR
jgi:hypothetical protein